MNLTRKLPADRPVYSAHLAGEPSPPAPLLAARAAISLANSPSSVAPSGEADTLPAPTPEEGLKLLEPHAESLSPEGRRDALAWLAALEAGSLEAPRLALFELLYAHTGLTHLAEATLPATIRRDRARGAFFMTAALWAYAPATPVSCPIVMVLAKDDEPGDRPPGDAYWRGQTTGAFRCVSVGGTHTSILAPAHIDALAAAVASGLAG
jgi:thioesterase domain-containing protein